MRFQLRGPHQHLEVGLPRVEYHGERYKDQRRENFVEQQGVHLGIRRSITGHTKFRRDPILENEPGRSDNEDIGKRDKSILQSGTFMTAN